MKGVIDRFEGEYAVVADDSGNTTNIKKEFLPKEAREGDVLVIDGTIIVDREETERRKKNAEKYLDLWEE